MMYESAELSKIFLDLKNPRHAAFNNETEAIAYLCKEEKILELAKDIAENGLNPLEILAVLKKDDGSFFCAEGNRRICALKLLTNPELAPPDLQDDFIKAAEGWKPIKQLDVAEFKDRAVSGIWLDRIHGGDNDGIGRLQWNTVQKARNNTRHKSKFELKVLEYGKSLGFVVSDDWYRRLSAVTIYLGNPLMRKTIGLKERNADLLKTLSGVELSAFKQFMKDVDERKINTRADKEKIEIYANNLIKNKGAGKAGSSTGSTSTKASENTSSFKPSLKPSPSPKFPQISKIPSNPKLEKALKKLSNYKLQRSYYSLCSIDLSEHTPFLYIGAWAFIEILTAECGRNDRTSFPSFLNKKRVAELLSLNKKDTEVKDIWDVVEKFSKIGNITKHNKTAANFDGKQLVSDFQTIEDLLVALVKEAIEEKNKEN